MRKIEPDNIISVHRSLYKVRTTCLLLGFKGNVDFRFHENSFSGSRIVFMVTDRRDKACRGFVEAAKN